MFAAPADGRDRVYWGNYGNETISFANLDGSGGGGQLSRIGTGSGAPRGLALDPAGGRLLWVNEGGPKVSFARLDGSGGADLNVTGATPTGSPSGATIDPTTGRLYWAIADRISFAKLDGSGGGDLATSGGTFSGAGGVAIDPATATIYWANFGATEGIAFARLDGSGGGNLNTTGATVDVPEGVAIDPVARVIYWANQGSTARISFARLDGTGGGDVVTTGATVSGPIGVAVDPEAGRVYWGNFGGNTISFANLDGSGGGDLNTTGATLDSPIYPVLLKAPRAAGAPTVSGGPGIGSVLSCSSGSWAPDLQPAALYRAPSSFAFRWSVGGAEIAGATDSSYTALAPGDYRCTVTASNAAGGTEQTSAPYTVGATRPAFGARTLVSMRLAANRIPARGPLRVRVANRNGFAITGLLAGRTVNRVTVAVKRRVRLGRKRFSVRAGSGETVRLRLPRTLRREFRRTGVLRLGLVAQVTDPAGTTRTVKKRVRIRLKRR